MVGRKPKPTEMKKLEGNPGKRKLNKRNRQFRTAFVEICKKVGKSELEIMETLDSTRCYLQK